MSENGGEYAFGIIARQGKGIGVTNACRLDFDEDLSLFRTIQRDGLDRERLAGKGSKVRISLAP